MEEAILVEFYVVVLLVCELPPFAMYRESFEYPFQVCMVPIGVQVQVRSSRLREVR